MGESEDSQRFKHPIFALVLSILGIVVLFAAPAFVFLYFIMWPESEVCWSASNRKTATQKPTFRADDTEIDMAPLYAFWTYSGFVFNLLCIGAFIYALRVPCVRVELTYVG